MLFNAILENACSELGARVSAMDSSSRNAGDMLDRLTLTYNRFVAAAKLESMKNVRTLQVSLSIFSFYRTRQASITTELSEIISGAAALTG